MPRRRSRVLRRTRFFVAAEGESEQSLAAWLQFLCDEQGLRVHLDIHVAGGGDSLAIVQFANARYDREQSPNDPFNAGFVLLDSDRLRGDIRSGRDPAAALERYGLYGVYLKPNLESLLLRLHRGQETQRPTADDATRRLRSLWPDYKKPASAHALRKRFGIEDLRRVARHDEGIRWVSTTLNLVRYLITGEPPHSRRSVELANEGQRPLPGPPQKCGPGGAEPTRACGRVGGERGQRPGRSANPRWQSGRDHSG